MIKTLTLLVCTASFLFAGCTSTAHTSPDKEQTGEVPTEPEGGNPSEPDEGNPSEPEEEWTGDYPKGVNVYDFREDFSDGKFCCGYIAEIDFKENPKLKFNVCSTVPKKTPSTIYKEFSKRLGKPCLAVNGGYFAGSTSVSLAIINNWPEWIQPRSINWPNDEQYKKTVYPVRSAIGLMEDGKFNISWVYCTDLASKKHSAFPSALDNNEKTETFMTEAPDPEKYGGKPWKPVEGIGGGPRLVKDGKDVAVENYWKECLHSGGTAGTSRQPRTAIGYTADNKLVIIVCDGRGMNGSAGYTLSELAKKFISLGVTNAMNLDGGGSSAMVGKDGKVLNRPSDTGKNETIIERKVVTSIVISELEK